MNQTINQKILSDIFIASQIAYKKYKSYLDSGWGSSSNNEIDSLWNSNSNEHYERSHPDGEWILILPMGKT